MRFELYAAIEKVLPPDLRQYAKVRRREALATDRKAEEERRKAEELRNAPLLAFDFMVAGTSYGGRRKIIKQFASDGCLIQLVREYSNEYSRNAILVNALGGNLGYVPEDWAVEMAPLLDNRHGYTASVKKILDYGERVIPVIVGEVHRETHQQGDGWRAAFRQAEANPQGRPADEKPTGVLQSCMSCAAVIVGSIILMFIVAKC